MSRTDAALELLAAAAGIEPAYRDTSGIIRPTAPETAPIAVPAIKPAPAPMAAPVPA